MMIVAVLGAVDAVIVRLLSNEVHPFIMVFSRAVFGLMAMLPWILGSPGIMKTKRFGLHFLRAALKLASLIALFAAMARAPLATVTAIGFASPIFVTLGAWLFFGEQRRATRIFGIVLGFTGVIVLLQPSEGVPTVALVLALISAVLVATIQLMLKFMGASEKADTLVAWNLVATVPIALIPAVFVWATPSLIECGLLAVQGAIGAASQFMVTKAFQLADASVVSPIDFLRLPFVAAAAYIFFGEVADQSTWIGAVIIFVAILMMAVSLRNRRGLES